MNGRAKVNTAPKPLFLMPRLCVLTGTSNEFSAPFLVKIPIENPRQLLRGEPMHALKLGPSNFG